MPIALLGPGSDRILAAHAGQTTKEGRVTVVNENFVWDWEENAEPVHRALPVEYHALAFDEALEQGHETLSRYTGYLLYFNDESSLKQLLNVYAHLPLRTLAKDCVVVLASEGKINRSALRTILKDQVTILADPSRAFQKLIEKLGLPATLPLSFTTHSQIGQDVWVAAEVFPGMKGGYFLDVGAADGKNLSNTLALEQSLGWHGLCVEASPTQFELLKENRPNATLVHACLASTAGEMVNFIEAGDFSGRADLMNNAQSRSSTTLTLETTTLAQVLKSNNVPQKIDFLSIDIEGAECDVLSVFPFEEYQFGCIAIEHNWHAENRSKLRELFESNDYVFCRALDFDDLYVHKSTFRAALVKCPSTSGVGAPISGLTRSCEWLSLEVKSSHLLLSFQSETKADYAPCTQEDALRDPRRQLIMFEDTPEKGVYTMRVGRTDANTHLIPSGGLAAVEGALVHCYIKSISQVRAMLWRVVPSADEEAIMIQHVATNMFLTVKGVAHGSCFQIFPQDEAIVSAQTFTCAADPRQSTWICKHHGVKDHDVFISYRVASESAMARELFWALSAQKRRDGTPIRVFLDKFCLRDGENWERGFLAGLDNAAVIVLLLSEKSLARIETHAAQSQDNVLLEIEYALEKQDKCTAKVLPLCLGNVQPGRLDRYPNLKHCTNKSSHTIRETMERLWMLQAPKLDPNANLDILSSIVTMVEEVEAQF